MSDEETTLEVKGLSQLLKALKARPPVCRVGILGTKNAREGSGTTNSEVGAVHEYGTSTHPQRSFLRIPITENLDREMESGNLLTEDVMKEVIRSGTVNPWLEKVAIAALAVVDDTFESGGDGKWPAWKDPGYKNNGNMVLVDTGQLRRSITYEIK